jgi:uncharacterized membrane protein
MRVDHTIHIDAPPEVVWAVTEDVERWPEWTPAMVSVRRLDEGPFGPRSTALIKQRGLPEARWSVTEFARGERFSWQTRVRGLRMVASHELTPHGTGTRNRLQVEVSGFAAVLLWPLMRFAMRRALSRENRGLKGRCEAQPADSPRRSRDAAR